MRRRWLGLVLVALVSAGCSRATQPLPSTPLLYVVGMQGGLAAYDPSEGKQVRTYDFPLYSQVAVAPDGQLQVLKRGRAVPNLTEYKLFDAYVSLSQDGRWLFALMREVTGPGQDRLWVEVYDTKEAKWLPQKLEPGCRPWHPVAFNDGNTVAVVCRNEVALLPREGGHGRLVSLPGAGMAAAVVQAPDGAVYTAQRDGTLAELDVKQGAVVRQARLTLPQDSGVGGRTLMASPDGATLYLGVGDAATMGGLTEIWAVSARDFALTMRFQAPEKYQSVALSPDGKELFVLAGKTVHVLDAASGKALRSFQVSTATPPAFLLTPGRP